MENVKSLDVNIPGNKYDINLQGFTVKDLATMFNVNISAPEPTYNIEIDTKWAGTDNIEKHVKENINL